MFSMETNDYLNAIDNFIINRSYHYALLLNGEWGCGKTYFVQNELIPHLKDKRGKHALETIIYLSLYGVGSFI